MIPVGLVFDTRQLKPTSIPSSTTLLYTGGDTHYDPKSIASVPIPSAYSQRSSVSDMPLSCPTGTWVSLEHSFRLAAWLTLPPSFADPSSSLL